MIDDEPGKPLSEQSLEELLETATRLKVARLKNIQKSEQVVVELLSRARKRKEEN